MSLSWPFMSTNWRKSLVPLSMTIAASLKNLSYRTCVNLRLRRRWRRKRLGWRKPRRQLPHCKESVNCRLSSTLRPSLASN
ncbi:hypothetical protein I310_03746 [Cryptococcus deuterogattii CA1014]|nr:hypothetical protein I310_03746 [Cryptococcus deuterogattii CA1014]